MSLLYNANTDYFDIANHSSLDDVDKLSWFMWIYLDAENLNYYLWGQESGGAFDRRSQTKLNGIFAVAIDTDPSGFAQSQTNSSAFSTGEWSFLAACLDIGTSYKSYAGNLTTVVADVTDTGEENAGSNPIADGTGNLKVGNGWTHNVANNQKIAVFAFLPGVCLTLDQLKTIQYNPSRCLIYSPAVYMQCGLHGASACPDLSGNGNNGQNFTNLGLWDHVPLPPPFGFDEDRVFCAPILDDRLYSKGSYATLPTDDSKLEDSFTCKEYALVES